MCGLLAVLGVAKGANSIRTQVLKQARKLTHRGPDWRGVSFVGPNALVHQRLSIVGVQDGAQPLYNKSKTTALLVNGEIYNHKELRDELEQGEHKSKVHFQTKSDCECILHHFETAKPGQHKAWLNKLDGTNK
jgi:asparagine synthase (glutamine-hydrolysing)